MSMKLLEIIHMNDQKFAAVYQRIWHLLLWYDGITKRSIPQTFRSTAT